MTLQNVLIGRTTHGFAAGAAQPGNKQTYFVSGDSGSFGDGMSLEDATHNDKVGDVTLPASGNSLTVGVKCAQPTNTACAADNPVSVDIDKVGMQLAQTAAADKQAPKFAVGGTHTPAGDAPLKLDVEATDDVGLRTVTYQWDNSTVHSYTFADADSAYAGCYDMTPSTPSFDMPVDATCPTVASYKPSDAGPPTPDPKTGAPVPSGIPISDIGNGFHMLTVKVTDIFGNTGTNKQTIEIQNNKTPACANLRPARRQRACRRPQHRHERHHQHGRPRPTTPAAPAASPAPRRRTATRRASRSSSRTSPSRSARASRSSSTTSATGSPAA